MTSPQSSSPQDAPLPPPLPLFNRGPYTQRSGSFKVLSRPGPSLAIDTQNTRVNKAQDAGQHKSHHETRPQPLGRNNSDGATDKGSLHQGTLVTSPSTVSPNHTNAGPHILEWMPSPTTSTWTNLSSVPGLSDSRGTTLESVSQTPQSRSNSAGPSSVQALKDQPGLHADAVQDADESEALQSYDTTPGEESSGGQTPRVRRSEPFTYGFSSGHRTPHSSTGSMSINSGGRTPGPSGDLASEGNNDTLPRATPLKRPSLLTQQILSSPGPSRSSAVPPSSYTADTAATTSGSVNLVKRPSFKDRVKKGLLLGRGSRDPHANEQTADDGQYDRSHTSSSTTSRKPSNRSCSQSSHHAVSEEGLEELADEHRRSANLNIAPRINYDNSAMTGRGGRPRPHARSHTYTEGSSQDETERSSAKHGTSVSTFGRASMSATTEDDEPV